MQEIVGNRIIGFGDSITAGASVELSKNWIGVIRARLAKTPEFSDVEICNAGVGGNTSREGLARYDADVEPLLPGVVIIEFGGNDATSDLTRHVKFDEFDKNIRSIVRNVRAKGGEPVLMTFPPVVDEWHSTSNDAFFEPYGGCDGLVEVYREITRALAKELGCKLIDLDEKLRQQMDKLGAEVVIQADGVHLTVEGNALAAQIILDALGINLDEL